MGGSVPLPVKVWGASAPSPLPTPVPMVSSERTDQHLGCNELVFGVRVRVGFISCHGLVRSFHLIPAYYAIHTKWSKELLTYRYVGFLEVELEECGHQAPLQFR